MAFPLSRARTLRSERIEIERNKSLSCQFDRLFMPGLTAVEFIIIIGI